MYFERGDYKNFVKDLTNGWNVLAPITTALNNNCGKDGMDLPLKKLLDLAVSVETSQGAKLGGQAGLIGFLKAFGNLQAQFQYIDHKMKMCEIAPSLTVKGKDIFIPFVINWNSLVSLYLFLLQNKSFCFVVIQLYSILDSSSHH